MYYNSKNRNMLLNSMLNSISNQTSILGNILQKLYKQYITNSTFDFILVMLHYYSLFIIKQGDVNLPNKQNI